MTFTVPQPDGQEQFEFTIEGSEDIHRIPKLKHLPVGMVEQVESGGLTGFLQIFGDPDSPTGRAVRQLDTRGLEALMEGWQADSGVTVGESSASSKS